MVWKAHDVWDQSRKLLPNLHSVSYTQCCAYGLNKGKRCTYTRKSFLTEDKWSTVSDIDVKRVKWTMSIDNDRYSKLLVCCRERPLSNPASPVTPVKRSQFKTPSPGRRGSIPPPLSPVVSRIPRPSPNNQVQRQSDRVEEKKNCQKEEAHLKAEEETKTEYAVMLRKLFKRHGAGNYDAGLEDMMSELDKMNLQTEDLTEAQDKEEHYKQ